MADPLGLFSWLTGAGTSAAADTATQAALPAIVQENVASFTPEMFGRMSQDQLTQAGLLNYGNIADGALGTTPSIINGLGGKISDSILGKGGLTGGDGLLSPAIKAWGVWDANNTQKDIANRTLDQNQQTIDMNQTSFDRKIAKEDKDAEGLAKAAAILSR